MTEIHPKVWLAMAILSWTAGIILGHILFY